MKHRILAVTLLLATTTVFGMSSSSSSSSSSASSAYMPALVETYPASMGFIPESELHSLCVSPPDEIRERVEELLRAHPHIADLCSLPKQHAAILSRTPIPDIPPSLSTHNFVFGTDVEYTDVDTEYPDGEVVKMAGFHNALRSSISALGYDPYSRDNPPNVVLRACSSKTPRFQHLSTLVTMKLLERAQSATVVPVTTWAYRLPEHPGVPCDQNHIVVQRRLPAEYKQFSTLSTTEKRDVLGQLDLAKFYRVLKYANLWNPSEENLWVNSSRQSEIAYPDGEKPNNEGAGRNAKFPIAIFGQGLSKARFNIRNPCDGGHRVFEGILQAHSPDKVAEWMRLYEEDTDMK